MDFGDSAPNTEGSQILSALLVELEGLFECLFKVLLRFLVGGPMDILLGGLDVLLGMGCLLLGLLEFAVTDGSLVVISLGVRGAGLGTTGFCTNWPSAMTDDWSPTTRH